MNDKIRQEAMHLHNWCEGQYDCAHCDFGRDNRTCKISGIPAQWFDDEDHSADDGKKYGTPTDTPTETYTPTDTPTTRAEILDSAKKIVTGDREKQYGKPEDNFAVIARFWEVYLSERCTDGGAEVTLNPDDVAMLMALMKVARIMTGTFKGDSYIDACGYLACAAEIAGR